MKQVSHDGDFYAVERMTPTGHRVFDVDDEVAFARLCGRRRLARTQANPAGRITRAVAGWI